MKKYHLPILLVLSVFSNPLQAESVSLYNDSNLLHTQNNKAFHDFKDSVSLSLAEPEFVNSYCILTSDSTYAALPKETGIIGPHKNKTTSLLGKIGKVADAASAFVNSYCILTSDSTYAALPKETGIIGPHKNKTTSLLGKIGKVADAASAIGGLGSAIGLSANSSKAVLSGVKASMTAMSVSNVADAASALTGAVGMDIIFSGKNSSLKYKKDNQDIRVLIKAENNEYDPVADAASALTGAVGMDIIFSGKNSSLKYKKDNQDIRVLIKAENNEYDPHGLYRLVRFSTTKKERRIQWLQIDAGVIDEDAKKKGYIPFRAEKYGQQSYLLTIPSSEIEKGEYGIIFMGAESTQYIPVATFSVS